VSVSSVASAQVALRPRSGLKAVDLGFQLARAWWRPLATTWIALVLPLLVIVLFVMREHPVVWLALLWWLRPVFARVPLHVLAGRLFGEPVGVRATARALPRLLRSGIPGSLLLQRLSPARTMLLPVLQLEGLRGAARRQRAALLSRVDLGSAAALAAAGAHITIALIVGLVLLADLFVPAEWEWEWEQLLSFAFGDDALPVLFPALYAVAISVVEPLMVAGGFALYVNRRVFLEGWDIELAFRRLSERAAHSPLRKTAAAVPISIRPPSPPTSWVARATVGRAET
jgi:hypothetical protein